ncbi:hypothetical protein BU23DRAFT_656928 [Bimuria novae-zelandiae CBS 107.79]|uniref:Uncharacterized protein n=1 Tax=Bimuria novae-zelandiae CBS 107.79 TaxID=1447943 RepID=A0A6A5UZ75_9PLEO|nr:hypothetical protein BU23DRAFT_656928 [Bimuria novae-zelandiae CBS 107.79]
MEHWKRRTWLNLVDEGATELYAHIDWSVHEDAGTLKNTTEDKVRRRFIQWTKDHIEEEDWLGTPRFQACVSITQDSIQSVLEGPPAEKFDADGEGMVDLISIDEDQGMTFAGVSYLLPGHYSLLEIGWEHIAADPDEGEGKSG